MVGYFYLNYYEIQSLKCCFDFELESAMHIKIDKPFDIAMERYGLRRFLMPKYYTQYSKLQRRLFPEAYANHMQPYSCFYVKNLP